MKLSDYFEARGAQASLCKEISVHASMLSTWASGARPVPIERCVDIEVATRGAVTRRDLRPGDWWRIWPELVTEGHPAPVQSAA